MVKLGPALGGGATVIITCALLSFVYTPEQISELTGYNVTSILPFHAAHNAPQIIWGNNEAPSYVETQNGVAYALDADYPQQPSKPQGNRRKPTESPLNGSGMCCFDRSLIH